MNINKYKHVHSLLLQMFTESLLYGKHDVFHNRYRGEQDR